MRNATLTFAAVVVAGLAGLLAVSILDRRELAFTLGVEPALVAAVANAGQTICQGPIDAPVGSNVVAFKVDTAGKPGPPIEITARGSSGDVVGRGRVAGGYANRSNLHASVGGIIPGRTLRLCFRNAGRRTMGIYGNGPAAARTSTAAIDGADTGTDLALVFERTDSRSMLAMLPDVFERASLWHPGWVGVWTFWMLLGLVVVGVPLLLWRALDSAEQVPAESYSSHA